MTLKKYFHKDIRIIPAADIDREKWDACIDADPHALIYAHSWWLDHMADHWHGIVWKDYETVLPLPLKKKWGLQMGYIPPFIQQLDIAGNHDQKIREVLAAATLASISLLHYKAGGTTLFPGVPARHRTNYILPLQDTYDHIAARYTTPCRKNIAQAGRRGCSLSPDVSIAEVIHLYRDVYGGKASYQEAHYQRLSLALAEAGKRGNCHQTKVVHATSGRTVFAGLLLDDGRKLYYLLGAPTQEGRQMRATYFFIDRMLEQFAGRRLAFDFEGSDIPPVATFYRSFSPDTIYYEEFYVNKYPFPLNKLLNYRLNPFR